MPQPTRRINFVGANDVTDPVRGRRVFEEQGRLIPDLVVVSQSLQLETDRCGLYVVLMPCSVGIAERLEHVAALPCSCRSIVDVHADFWHPRAELAGDVDWWCEGDRIAVLERCIRAADLVTVPSPALRRVAAEADVERRGGAGLSRWRTDRRRGGRVGAGCDARECPAAPRPRGAAVSNDEQRWVVAPIEQPDGTIVNLGDILGDVAKACDDVAANLQPSSTVPDSAAAFIRLGRTFAAAAKALARVQVFVPKDQL
jgi:hypothetical protein